MSDKRFSQRVVCLLQGPEELQKEQVEHPSQLVTAASNHPCFSCGRSVTRTAEWNITPTAGNTEGSQPYCPRLKFQHISTMWPTRKGKFYSVENTLLSLKLLSNSKENDLPDTLEILSKVLYFFSSKLVPKGTGRAAYMR